MQIPADNVISLGTISSFQCDRIAYTPYNGLYGEAPAERGTFFRLWVYEKVGISLDEVYLRVGESVISLKRPKRANG